MNYLHIIFHDIPRIVFLPFMLTAFAGSILLLLRGKKKTETTVLSIICVLLFMYFWRVGIIIESSRYAAILILPCILLTVFGIAELCKIIKAPWRKPLFLTAVLLLALGCFGKLARYNRYSGTLPENCAAMLKDSRQYPGFKVCDLYRETARIRYYTKCSVDSGELKKGPLEETLRPVLGKYSVPVYFFVKDLKKNTPLPPEKLGLSPEEWMLISAHPENNRRKYVLSVYRYVPKKWRSRK